MAIYNPFASLRNFHQDRHSFAVEGGRQLFVQTVYTTSLGRASEVVLLTCLGIRIKRKEEGIGNTVGFHIRSIQYMESQISFYLVLHRTDKIKGNYTQGRRRISFLLMIPRSSHLSEQVYRIIYTQLGKYSHLIGEFGKTER